MWDDPVVKEVREAGKRLQEKCNNDLKLFLKMITEGTEKLKREGWKNENSIFHYSKVPIFHFHPRIACCFSYLDYTA